MDTDPTTDPTTAAAPAIDWDARETVTVNAATAKFLADRLRAWDNLASPRTDPTADVTVTLTRKGRALVAGFLVTNNDPDRGGVNHDGISLGADTWHELTQAFPYDQAAPPMTTTDLAMAEAVFPRSLFDEWAAAHPWDSDPETGDNYYPHSGY